MGDGQHQGKEGLFFRKVVEKHPLTCPKLLTVGSPGQGDLEKSLPHTQPLWRGALEQSGVLGEPRNRKSPSALKEAAPDTAPCPGEPSLALAV